MPSIPAGDARPQHLHPLVVACLSALVVRAVGVLRHYTSQDPSGNAISSGPFETLLIALPYHGVALLFLTGTLFLLWRLLPPLRRLVTVAGILLILSVVTLGTVDFAMQWFTGRRFAIVEARTYLGRNMLSGDVLGPLLYHWQYLTVGLLLLLLPFVSITWSLRRTRRVSGSGPGWRLIGATFGLWGVCLIPPELAYSHQREVLIPPELLFVYRLRHPSDVTAPSDSVRAIASLHSLIDPRGEATWLSPALPVVRATAGPPNRFLGDRGPAVLPDVFVVAVESLRGADVGFVPGRYADGTSPTPRLDVLAHSGVVFTRYLATGNPSPRGFIGINTGVWDHRESFITSGATATTFDAIPLRARRRGYFTLGVWGANPAFDNQLLWARRWFDLIRAPAPAHPFTIVRSLPDDRLVDQVVDEVRAHDRARPDQPIFAYVATAGTHAPYVILPGGRTSDDTIRAVAAERDPRMRYRRMLSVLDAQVGRFADFLASRRVTRPTVLVVVGDHADIAGDSIPPFLRGMPHDAVAWTSALIVAPTALVGPPRVERFPSGHADLMPTVLHLMGDCGPTVAMGTDLFADVPPESRTALSNSGFAYRLDRGDGWTLIVRRLQPEVRLSGRTSASIAGLHEGLSGSPFTVADAQRLWESQNTWSWLIEQDRVWQPSVLDGGNAPATTCERRDPRSP